SRGGGWRRPTGRSPWPGRCADAGARPCHGRVRTPPGPCGRRTRTDRRCAPAGSVPRGVPGIRCRGRGRGVRRSWSWRAPADDGAQHCMPRAAVRAPRPRRCFPQAATAVRFCTERAHCRPGLAAATCRYNRPAFQPPNRRPHTVTRKPVLLRHGQRQWHLENRYTGWGEVDLPPQGRAQPAPAVRFCTERAHCRRGLAAATCRYNRPAFQPPNRRPHTVTRKLVLLRRGQSQWNLETRFTGWVDVDLTEQGRAEAAAGGRLMREEGLRFDVAYTSTLKRAIR